MNECWERLCNFGVICKTCKEWYDTTAWTVEFLNVEENAFGEDSFTFICHVCNKKQTSLIRGK